jgi:hypothetical protein
VLHIKRVDGKMEEESIWSHLHASILGTLCKKAYKAEGNDGYQHTKNIVPNYNQQDATFLDLFISTDSLHVSGGFSVHHQEHITVHTASGIVNQYCC